LKALKLLYVRGNKSLKLPASLKNKRYVKHGTCREKLDVEGKKVNISLFREFLRWNIHKGVNSHITGMCSGPWLWIELRKERKTKEWQPWTDRASGDDVSFCSGNDWVGLIENISSAITCQQDLDDWACYATHHSYTYRDWACDETGSWVRSVSEDGKIMVESAKMYFNDAPDSKAVEIVQLGEE
jgi:hypothetical protein